MKKTLKNKVEQMIKWLANGQFATLEEIVFKKKPTENIVLSFLDGMEVTASSGFMDLIRSFLLNC